MSDYECPRCHEEWDDKKKGSGEAYRKHILEGNCELRQAKLDDDKLTPDEFKKLGKLYSNGQSAHEKWYWLWDTFFSSHPRPTSPYIEIPGDFFDTAEPAIDKWLRIRFNLENGQDTGSKELVEAMKQSFHNAPERFRLPVPPVDTGDPAILNAEQLPCRSMFDTPRGPARLDPYFMADVQEPLDYVSQLQSAPDFGTNPESFAFPDLLLGQPLDQLGFPFYPTPSFDDPLNIDMDLVINPGLYE
jgi:hypothetical protein